MLVPAVMTASVSVPIPVIPVVPACVVELSSTEIPSMFSVESATVVVVISAILVVAAPCGVGVIGVAGEISFESDPGVYADL